MSSGCLDGDVCVSEAFLLMFCLCVYWYCFGPKRNYEHSVLDMLSCVPVTVLGKNYLLACSQSHVSWAWVLWAVSHMKTSFGALP